LFRHILPALQTYGLQGWQNVSYLEHSTPRGAGEKLHEMVLWLQIVPGYQ
jgi:hypothetical protein